MDKQSGKSDDPTPKDYMFIFLGLGLIFFCIGLYFAQKVFHLHSNGVITTGTVVGYNSKVTGFKVREVVEYYQVTTPDGEFRVAIDELVDLGSEVTFLYDPEDRDTTFLISEDYQIYELIRVSHIDLNLTLLWGTSLLSFIISGWYYKKHRASA